MIDDDMRSMFAAFALQGLMSSIDLEMLESADNRLFLAETAYDMADAMIGIRNETTRH
jgi:hypothetical protein